MNRKKKGEWGEQITLDLLKKKGYIIKERNFWSKEGEIDIIAVDNEVTVFIEVKVVSVYNMEELEYIVDKKKQERLRKCALLYIKDRYNTIELPMRFDIVAVTDSKKIMHIENAF